ncbi:MAG: GNAT family N-acetyltransferase [Hamadaea sp.]|uniref:GNAT family N-acetyltransferase n=1 Tax=Hamadaea sp. TaxID=2024425 RepID=UPI001807F1FA|nr:GNAT family N-acetyltransferase [Hamadaea sp.]NUR69970.1 GNAT family N-acetyltransferase [Hamadaea sp.]NUT20648.1 GNAT family N-acetyltransferase [Hamadaea sp.]
MSTIDLRPVEDADHDEIFEMMRDPEAVEMAAFTAQDPNDRAAFEAHLRKIRANPEVMFRVITCDGALVGTISSFVMEGDTEITYWVDRARWGQGVASRALKLFLPQVAVRPLFARAASDNVGSLRVLEMAGFRVVGSEVSYANGRGGPTEEAILTLPGGHDR